ncbi:ABC transporter ATP-binding protein [Rhodoplanes sp. Z2-YC6860]|uniref:ABC transporter ATP-binding protein n=1 Tax=Rhodoplanes sp. Z2-YC6860 TaxID=674703 RepID=UPI00078D8CCD|nr:ABC transporter ATP-binding protein [Rhodoplanes sp. Z2-YC6860]AMN40501.1 spermidine/putrescine ABC transporter ATPase [Rhodoplanes sp. Z2-YC6860]
MSGSSPAVAIGGTGASGAQVQLRGLIKAFGNFRAVDNISLDIPAGAFVSLLGPSGSGKTTTLNLIAGFLLPDGGDILFDDKPVSNIPSHRRNIGMVFQSYALFPHMTVADNVGFPLKMRTRLRGGDARDRISEMLSLMRLSHLEGRYPRQLSGGQQQRVAMARALVSSPRLLLMDEPLGALDKKLREQMQIEIKHIHRTVGTTIVYVTHDQTEALTMSDLVVVMHQSRVAQVGTPRALYDAPANAFVADFLGDSNLLEVRVRDESSDLITTATADGHTLRIRKHDGVPRAGERAALLIRPADITVAQGRGHAGDHQTLSGTISDISYHGDGYRISVPAAGGTLQAIVPRTEGAHLERGQMVTLSWPASVGRLLPIDGADNVMGGAET